MWSGLHNIFNTHTHTLRKFIDCNRVKVQVSQWKYQFNLLTFILLTHLRVESQFCGSNFHSAVVFIDKFAINKNKCREKNVNLKIVEKFIAQVSVLCWNPIILFWPFVFHFVFQCRWLIKIVFFFRCPSLAVQILWLFSSLVDEIICLWNALIFIQSGWDVNRRNEWNLGCKGKI